ncbi:MAG: M13 family metallopeptidase [Bacteroidota bacterium]
MIRLKKKYGLVILVLLFACTSTTEKEIIPIDLSNMDNTVAPGEDFFRFANGNWLENNPIPEEYSKYGSFEHLEQLNYDRLKSLLLTIQNDKNAEKGSNRQKIRDFYESGMDIKNINSQGIEPLSPIFARIHKLESNDEVAILLAELHNKGFRPFFWLRATQDRSDTETMIGSIMQSGLGMSDRDYYLKDDERTIKIRDAYKKMIAEIFGLVYISESKIEKKLGDIIAIETTLAEASMSRLEIRNPYATFNKMSVESLNNLSPGFNWNLYFTERNLDIEEINVGMPDFISTFSNVISEYDIESIKNYIEWNVLRASSPFIGDNFEEATFEFYGKVMSGREKNKKRWKRVLRYINYGIGEALGQEYVAEYFPEEAKERMDELVEYLREAFLLRINKLDWMTEDTKERAREKLNVINVKIGYPDKWKDYSELEISKQAYVLNVLASREFNIKSNIGEIGKAVNRDKWFMNAQTVNAYYSPTMNEIVFPAAILQPPFFYMHADDAVNFGAIGMVIGHEMTHGFDDQGRHYNSEGILNDWWTELDAEQFKERTKVLVDQYNNYVMLDSLTINGELSLGENIADLGGLNIAYTALKLKLKDSENTKLIDGYTPEQRFFISYAQIWRNNIRDQELMRQLQEGPHSPGEARVNGIVYNLDAFYETFDVSEEDSRYIPKEERARIW